MQTQKEALILLAQKIREGAKETLELASGYYELFNGDQYTCALGAAAYACGYKGNLSFRVYETIQRCIGLDLSQPIPVEHPLKKEQCFDLSYVIFDLNDEYDWTREAIADWVEGIVNE